MWRTPSATPRPCPAGQWRVPVGLALERVQHLDRPRAVDALAGDARLAVAQRVAPPQLDRIDAQLLGDHVDVALAGEHRLRIARRAHRAARNAVGVDRLDFEPGHRHVVRASASLCAGTTSAGRDLAGRVRAAVDDGLGLVGQELAVATDRRAQLA